MGHSWIVWWWTKEDFPPSFLFKFFFWLNNYNETKFIPNHLTTVIVNDTYVNCVNIRLSLKTKLFLPEWNTKRNDYLVTSPCIEMKIPLCLISLKTKLTNPLGFLCLIFSHWEFAGFKENVLHPKTSLVCNTSATPALRVGETPLFGAAASHWAACPLRTGKDAENHSACSWMSEGPVFQT